jgi:hypothetical protein
VGRRHMPLFPVIQGQRHLGYADASFVGDPHRAVELVPSAPVREDIFPGHGLLAWFFGRESDLDSWVNVFGDQVVGPPRLGRVQGLSVNGAAPSPAADGS